MKAIDQTLGKLLDRVDLEGNEVREAMREIMAGEVSQVKLAAWLVALRMKKETAIEIAGCAEVMRENAVMIKCDSPNPVDLAGTGGDGANTFNISTCASLVAAGAGVVVAKHGNKAVSSHSGSADVFDALGVDIQLSPEKMEECLNSVGIAFLFAPALHPAMKHAMPVRRELGIRTIFNILGPLTNPARANRALLGVYDRKLAELIAEAAVNMNVEHFVVVHGQDGLDEISVTGETYVHEVKNGSVEHYMIRPASFGLTEGTMDDIKGGTPAENAETIREILKGGARGPKRDIVIMNAAAAIRSSGEAADWSAAIEKATSSIDSGAAMEKLEKLIAFTS